MVEPRIERRRGVHDHQHAQGASAQPPGYARDKIACAGVRGGRQAGITDLGSGILLTTASW